MRRWETQVLVLKDLALMLLVGDGVIGAASPERHLQRWTGGRWRPSSTGAAVTPRRLLRAAAATEAAAALYMAVRLPAPRR